MREFYLEGRAKPASGRTATAVDQLPIQRGLVLKIARSAIFNTPFPYFLR